MFHELWEKYLDDQMATRKGLFGDLVSELFVGRAVGDVYMLNCRVSEPLDQMRTRTSNGYLCVSVDISSISLCVVLKRMVTHRMNRMKSPV